MHIVLFRQHLNKKMQQMKMNQNRSMIMKMMRLAMMIKVAVDLVHSTQKTHIPILLLWKARATHSTARTTASLNIILFDFEISLLNPPITIASSTASHLSWHLLASSSRKWSIKAPISVLIFAYVYISQKKSRTGICEVLCTQYSISTLYSTVVWYGTLEAPR